ncbi:DUF2075 domain-containing protein [Rheinheimera sp. UJ63]|uniref:DUF2075 domain-containing protein n=1 Tax=Rheinheimera sp. UJ63 TaxID=2910157 RepID=UPI001F469010|nr:DUF2075 domain-containing protein [Rheinheimera sp. UJ63]MCF4008844.1 DUF2075 domain-containing protein [Rheinheimera sp. UJ63]
MNRAYYGASISTFLLTEESKIIGDLTKAHGQELQHSQTIAWAEQIRLLHLVFRDIAVNGDIFFEFMIPRMGRRADVIIITGGMIFVLEFKVGANNYSFTDRMQTMGYALDLKHFHEGSHNKYLVPILICTNAPDQNITLKFNSELVADVLCCSGANLAILINQTINQLPLSSIDIDSWLAASYKPTPTIIEAAQALYSNHNVVDITRSEAGSINIAETSTRLFEIIHNARLNRQKVVCFVTGVPGAGKTLVGLNIANQHATPKDDEYSVFLSGNGPLVAVLQEALSNDLYKNESVKKVDVGEKKLSKHECRKRVESFIQNIHRFRDNYLIDQAKPPEHVAIFDEAQRAWNQQQAAKFMQQKRGFANFNMSEPEFLISVMDRHNDWAVIIALVGGGQEINVGEVGILGWFDAMNNMFKHWHVYCSPNLLTGEYIREGIEQSTLQSFHQEQSLHLAISMRSFRAEKLSSFVHFLIAGNAKAAAQVYKNIKSLFPIVVTRNLDQAKAWLKLRTIANRRCGLLASSNAIRLKAEGIFVKNIIEPEKWFLASADDIRSSNFLEDAATEFDVQGLELDWSLIAWDADFRFMNGAFQHWRFSGTKWQRRLQNEQQRYLENAYRVLLTRAREGMVIFVPFGNEADNTRLPEFYCGTYQYLLDCGLHEI